MKWLPYGKWTCSNGREILFNRDYQPIWECSPNETPKAANPNEWVDNIEQEKTVFFYDGSTPMRSRKAKAQKALNEFLSA